MLNKNMNINLRESGVTYAMITQNTSKGVKMTTHCLSNKQFNDIHEAKQVVIKEISKEEHILLKRNELNL